MGIKEIFFGSGDRYNYSSLCMPTYPCAPSDKKKGFNFYGKGK